ncbi:uncharacterized protein LOC135486457 isoform X2 [Lineus longissimus]
MLQILSPNGTIITTLTRNSTNYVGTGDNTERYTERYEVKLPQTECLNCSIRLLRQALEKGFYFWACADVNIKTVGYTEKCSLHGRLLNGECQCDSLYSGSVCQYKDECWKDTDCNSHGSCIDRKSRAYPKKVCYCKKGWYGLLCEKESPMKDIPGSFVGYNHVEIRPDVIDIFWKMLKDEGQVEIIMRMKTTSWVAVGWRHLDVKTNLSCMNYPTLQQPSELQTTEFGGTQQTVQKPGRIHPMSCNDIVMGYVQGNLSYIHDYFTREQHTPQLDTFFGGKEDLTGAVGHERSEHTFMGFRKKLKATEPTDKSFVDEALHVIWARGPQISKMNVQPQDKNFQAMNLYAPYYANGDDDAMYHLNDRLQRGKLQLNFFKASPYKEIMDTTHRGIRSETQLGWELTIGVLFGSFGFMIFVTIILLCCKVDLAKTTNLMEKERKRNALRMDRKVKVVALEELGETSKTPVETTLVIGGGVLIESDKGDTPLSEVAVGNGAASEGSSDIQPGPVKSTHTSVDVISIESEVHSPPKGMVGEGHNDDVNEASVHVMIADAHKIHHESDHGEPPDEILDELSAETSVVDQANEEDVVVDEPREEAAAGESRSLVDQVNEEKDTRETDSVASDESNSEPVTSDDESGSADSSDSESQTMFIVNEGEGDRSLPGLGIDSQRDNAIPSDRLGESDVVAVLDGLEDEEEITQF